MKIQTLKDLKIALKDVSDEVLEDFGAGFNEEPYVELMLWGEEMEFESKWEEGKKSCPALEDIDKWITNISKLSQKLNKEDEDCDTIGFEEPVSSEDEVK